MSNSLWCDLHSKGDIVKLHDKCPNTKCNCQIQMIFTAKQPLLEGNGFKNTMKKLFKRSQTAWNEFLKPAVNVAAPFVGLAVSAKTEHPKVGQATANFLKSIYVGKI